MSGLDIAPASAVPVLASAVPPQDDFALQSLALLVAVLVAVDIAAGSIVPAIFAVLHHTLPAADVVHSSKIH